MPLCPPKKVYLQLDHLLIILWIKGCPSNCSEFYIEDYVSSVCLPFPEMKPDAEDSLMEDTDPEVAGWGAVDVLARRFADILQYVVVPFSDTEDCTRIYKVDASSFEEDHQ